MTNQIGKSPHFVGRDNQPAYWCEKQVARRLGLSVKTLQKWRYSGGGLPYHKFRGAIRYAISDVEQFEAAARRSSSSVQPMYTHPQSNNGETSLDRHIPHAHRGESA